MKHHLSFPGRRLFVVGLLLTAVAGAQRVAGSEPQSEKEAPVLLGEVTRETVESFAPDWVEAEVNAQPEAEAAQALAAVEPGAEVEVYFGSWCGDSRRELPRLWKALDQSGGDPAALPFKVRYVAIDRTKKEPAAEVAAGDVHYLPTFVVRRGGKEVGRIVETSPHGVEKDLCALLAGKAQGVLTTRTDLAPATPAKPPA